MKRVIIRHAIEEDAAEILELYSPYVRESAISFEYEVPALADFTKRILDISNQYPYLVCVFDQKIVGYAYAHRHMERAAYQWNAELSVYVSGEIFRMGIGKALYSAVIEILALQNIQNIYGIITLPNAGSEKLHAYFGFQVLGVYRKTGYKCGAWHDVAVMEKCIGKHENPPKPFVPIKEIDPEHIYKILDNCCGLIQLAGADSVLKGM